jgi:hypothetical protein
LSYLPVSINVLPAPAAHYSTAALLPSNQVSPENLVIPGFWEQAVGEYCNWLISHTNDERLKSRFLKNMSGNSGKSPKSWINPRPPWCWLLRLARNSNWNCSSLFVRCHWMSYSYAPSGYTWIDLWRDTWRYRVESIAIIFCYPILRKTV